MQEADNLIFTFIHNMKDTSKGKIKLQEQYQL
jgi:hypothetical protein